MIEAGAAGVHFEDQLASREEVRPHGRQGAGADRASSSAPSSPRASPPTCGRARPCSSPAPTPTAPSCSPATSTSATGRSSTGERTPEGFFELKSGVETRHRARPRLRALRRPGLVRDLDAGPRRGASSFAEGDPREVPGQDAAYNCSPSFNWKKHLDDATIAQFQRELGAMGYKFQFVTLAGFHALNLGDVRAGPRLPRARHGGLLASCSSASSPPRSSGYTATRHQREVGTGYFDAGGRR